MVKYMVSAFIFTYLFVLCGVLIGIPIWERIFGLIGGICFITFLILADLKEDKYKNQIEKLETIIEKLERKGE